MILLASYTLSLLGEAPLSSGDPLVDWITRAGPVGILAVIVVGFIRGWIVPGSALKDCHQERDRALELVYKQAELAQRALEVTEKVRSK